jgi:uncharacterized membrane protein
MVPPHASHSHSRVPESALIPRQDPTLARVETFSDGVFAFAITLLVLSIRMPHPNDPDANRGLLALLLDQWRSILAYLVSFMLVGMNWANHRVMFSKFVRSSHTLVWLNLIYLMIGVAFIPVPAGVLGTWLGDAKNEAVATVFFGVCITLGGSIFCLIWWYAAYRANLTDLDPAERRAYTAAYAPAPFLVAVITAIAFLSPWAAVTGFAFLNFIYILPMPRLMALKHERIRQLRGE